MKKIFTILAAVFLVVSVFAQAPQKMSYQAVLRNTSNVLVTSTAVGMQISILQGSSTGIAVYVETQTPSTNANGLVSLEIGTGTIVTGTFAGINWATGPYFIKTETDPTGGTAYTIAGTNELMSVPYALFSANGTPGATGSAGTNGTNGVDGAVGATGSAGTNGTNGVDGAVGATGSAGTNGTNGAVGATGANGTNGAVGATGTNGTNGTVGATGPAGGVGPFKLGKDTLGGIVYYIYIGADNLQHGLIVSKTESTAVWQASGVLVNANRTWDGAFNTNLMTNSAAATYIASLGAGWYLPSIDELNRLYNNRDHANKALNTGGFTLLSTTANYWSSSETNNGNAWSQNFANGTQTHLGTKDNTYYVRAVRAF